MVPVYIAEVAPFASRGALAYLFQLATTAGILAAQVRCGAGWAPPCGLHGCGCGGAASLRLPLHTPCTATLLRQLPPNTQLVNYGAQWIPGWGWRLSLGLAAMPASVLALGGLMLPESPSYLLEKWVRVGRMVGV